MLHTRGTRLLGAAAVGACLLMITAGCIPPGGTTPPALSATAAASPSSGTGTTSVTLTATASGGSGTYSFSWESSPSVAITNSGSANASATLVTPNTYVFTVTVTDSAGATATASASVTINAPPTPTVDAGEDQTTTVGATASFTASATGGTPPFSFQWIQTAGPGVTVNGATSQNASASFTQEGAYTFQVTVTDSAGATASDSLDVTVSPTLVSPITVNAGVDVPVAFGFGAGAQFVGPAGALAAVASDPSFNDVEISFNWEFLSGPTDTQASDVVVFNSSAALTTFNVIPSPTASATNLAATGLEGVANNIVRPGDYTFQVTAANPNGDTATDQVTISIVPAFGIPAAGGLAGLALENGQLTNRVAAPNSITVPYSLLTSVDGTVQFSLVDTSVAADAQPVANLNAVPVTASDPTAVETINAEVSGAARGTYAVNASLVAGLSTTAAAATGLTTHIQNALPSAVDVRVPAAGTDGVNVFGLVNSTNIAATPIVNIHGARQGAGVGGFLWDGTAVVCGDINGDGSDDVVTGRGGFVRIFQTVAADPTNTQNSPLGNAFNNDGALDGGGSLDVFRVASFGTGAAADGTVAASVSALELCDVDGNGEVDLIVGDSSFNGAGFAGFEGMAFLYYGGGFNGFTQNPFNIAGAGALLAGGQLDAHATFTRPDAAATDIHQFGHKVACGDVTGDGIDDIVVGAPSDDQGAAGVNTGAIYGFVGSGAPYAGDQAAVADTGVGASFRIVPTGALDNDLTGAALVLAQVDGSGPLDVVYGAPGFTSTAGGAGAEHGRVLVNLGGGGLTGNITAVGRTWEGNTANLGLGRSLAACDFNGDGTTDVIAGAEANSAATHVIATAAGRVFVIPGTQGSILFTGVGTNPLSGLSQIGGAQADSNLGASICCGDYDRDGNDDLLLTAPSATAANQQILLINGSGTPAATLTASTTFSNGAATQFLTIPADTAQALTFTAAVYNADGCAFCDINGDSITDIFWQGFLTGVAEAATISGAE